MKANRHAVTGLLAKKYQSARGVVRPVTRAGRVLLIGVSRPRAVPAVVTGRTGNAAKTGRHSLPLCDSYAVKSGQTWLPREALPCELSAFCGFPAQPPAGNRDASTQKLPSVPEPN